MRETLKDIDPTRLHHAYICVGKESSVVPKITLLLREHGITSPGNENLSIETYSTMAIEHALILRQSQSERSLSERKIFIISFNAITTETQDVLLKVMEEPTAGTHIFLVTPSIGGFKDTLLSRLRVLYEDDANDWKEAETFLGLPIAKRLSCISSLLKDFSDDEDTGRERARVLLFIQNITHVLYTHEHDLVKKRPELFAELLKVSSYIHDRGSSPKMLLEHVSLIL